MDKETLSHYGWIVILVLILAVMLALASPFGTFVADAVKSTTAGFFSLNQNAMGAAGIDIGDVAFPNGLTLTIDQKLGANESNPAEATGTEYVLSGTVSSTSGIKSLTVNGNEIAVEADGKWTTILTLTKNQVKEIEVCITDNNNETKTETGYVGYIEFIDLVLSSSYFSDIGYDTSITDLEIPATFKKGSKWYKVVEIGSSAFKDNTNLITVKVPDTVWKIGYSSFQGCSNLTTIDIPDSVTEIGAESTFYGCSSLNNVVLPKNLTKIGNNTFGCCTSFTSIGPIGSGASLEIPDSVTQIGYRSFLLCTGLQTVDFPETMEIIGPCAFEKCENIISVNIPDSVIKIRSRAFWECTNLKEVSIGENSKLQSIESEAFKVCKSLSSIVIPDTVTLIDTAAFVGCNSLAEIVFENTNGWYILNAFDEVVATDVDVTDAIKNVNLLVTKYNNHEWKTE